VTKKRSGFYGNKETKIVHCDIRGDQCREGEIAPKNLIHFKTFMEAYEQDYRPCQACHPEEHDI